MRVHPPLTFLAVIALAAACGGGTPAATTTAGPTATSAGPTGTAAGTTTASGTPATGGGDAASVSCNDGEVGTDVSIVGFAFEPAAVTADATNTVFWTNTGSTKHTITFVNGKDCGSLESGSVLHVKFLAPGTYPYHCNIHKAMTGTVTVNG